MYAAENDTVALLSDMTMHINRYFAIFIFLFGFTGNVLNILVLSQRNLRSNPCVWLFRISSIANLISILFGLTTRILSGWDYDSTETIDWLCKSRVFIVFSSRTNAFWLIMLATIDRWLLSCTKVHFRHLSTLKNARRISFIIILIICLIHLQIFYCYEANLSITPLKCYGKSYLCRHLNDYIYTVITIFIPLILMLVFGLLTILNVRQSQRRIQVVVNQPNLALNRNRRVLKKNIDRHLLKMLLVEIILLTLLILPQSIQKIYSTVTSDQDKSTYNISVDQFLYNLSLLLTFIASGMPFYVYTLYGGNLFRKALLNIFKC